MESKFVKSWGGLEGRYLLMAQLVLGMSVCCVPTWVQRSAHPLLFFRMYLVKAI